MNFLLLSLRNWGYRPLRTAVTVVGVAVAVATAFSLVAFHRGYQRGLERDLDRLGAHILVVPKGCPYDAASIALHGANWSCHLQAAYLDEVRSVRGVAAAAPVFMTALRAESGEQVVYLGVETNLLALKPAWRITGEFPRSTGEVLVGSERARRGNWNVGDHVVLPGLRSNATSRVAGIVSPTQGADDEFVFLPLAQAQQLFAHPGELTHILVRLRDPAELDAVTRQLRSCDAGLYMNVVPLTHLFRTIQALASSARVWLTSVTIVALLTAMAGVSNTVLMAVHERTRDIGVMRVLGASQFDVFRLFWLETIHVCLAGSALGILVALAGSRALDSWLRATLPFAPQDGMVRFDGWLIAAVIPFALVIGSLAAAWPAWRAARLPPAMAIRT